HPQHARAEADTGDSVEVIEQAGGEKWVDLAEEDDFPPVASNGGIEGGPFAFLEEFPRHPAAPQLAADEKGHGGPTDIADEIESKAPPDAEKEAAADGQHAAREEQHIARAIE